MDYDSYLDRQLEKHYKEEEASEEVSNCCGEPVYDETDICSDCEEHCDIITLGEFMTDSYESARADAADAQRDLEKDK